jgi:peroxiredoxin-like protein
MQSFQFSLSGTWQGGRHGKGTIQTEGLTAQVSIPGSMQGPGIGTNPDELLLAAAANCYMITLASILENRRIQVSSFQLHSEAVIVLEGSRLSYQSIVHRPFLVLEGESSEQRDLAEQCTYRAEKACMISQALRGNVEVTVEPRVE